MWPIQNGCRRRITERVTKHYILNWSSAPEIKDGEETGNITFVLTEVYETTAGVDDHFQQAQETLSLPHDLSEGLVEKIVCDRGLIKHSLWKD